MFVFLTGALVGCADPEVAPPSLTALTLDAADGETLDLGASRTLVAEATWDDGTTRDVTGEAGWTSSDAAVLTVEGGTVTGTGPGDATVEALLDGVAASVVMTVVDPGPYAVTVAGDWSRQHQGQGLDFFARVVDEADGSVVACGVHTADSAEWSLGAAAVLLPGHTYHGEAFADVNGDGIPNDAGHTYLSDPGDPVAGARTYDVPHQGAAPDWTGAACSGETELVPTSD